MSQRLLKTGIYGSFLDGDTNWGRRMNENLETIDSLLLNVVKDIVDTPPASPDNSATYLISSNPSGAFSGYAGRLALNSQEEGWVFLNDAPVGSIIGVSTSGEILIKSSSGWVNALATKKIISPASSTLPTSAAGKILVTNLPSIDFSSENLPVGSTLTIVSTNSSVISLTGTTFRSKTNLTNISSNGCVECIKTAPSIWNITGDLE